MDAAFLTVGALLCLFPASTKAQTREYKSFDAPTVFSELDSNAGANSSAETLVPSWWNDHVTKSFREIQPLEADVHTLLYLALQHSNQIKIAKREPLIQQTAIQEADSNFDWVKYLNANWNDTSEPIGNQLTAGGAASRFNDHILQGSAGVRRLNREGGLFDISQRLGWQDNNSIFLTPTNQATGQLTLAYTHPLKRGRGRPYNEALTVLARLETEAAEQTFFATLQDELLEVTRSYWALYLERAVLTHQMRLFLQTQQIHRTLEARQNVDTQGTQLILAASALENRRADLIRSRTAVTNAETRLRGLINAPELANSDLAELIPIEMPSTEFFRTELQTEIQTAITSRPEVKAAIQQVRAGVKRLKIAEHEMLPLLNLVTQLYANGLRGDSDFGRAFTDQFNGGSPSYTIGIQYELPIGNRLAKARVCRRRHEMKQLQDEYARALEAVETEVDIAVRELNTAHMEIKAKSRALIAAEAEANTIEQRWMRMVDGTGSTGLNLESLLRAQERVTEAERDYVTSVLTYNLAMISLKRANGTLLRSEDVIVNQTCEAGCKGIALSKGMSANNVNTPAQPTIHSEAFGVPVESTYNDVMSDGSYAPVQEPSSYPAEPAQPMELPIEPDYFRN